jgi:transposase
LTEPLLDEAHWQLRLLARHRRDLVEKRSSVCCQIREQLQPILPGYASLFDDQLWDSNVALSLACRLVSPQQVIERGVSGLGELLAQAKVRFQQRTLEKIVAWAPTAATPEEYASTRHRIFVTLDDDRLEKTREISRLERDLAHWLVRTPYVLLLSCPGINVTSSAELAGELGPIGNYARGSRITGRAGLYRSRYQSDEVDKQNGPLVRMGNRQLRAALMRIADNLILCNSYYHSLATLWRSKGQDERYIRTKIATRFSRLAFQLAAGRQVLHHRSMRGRDYILEKLMTFHQQHHTSMREMLVDLQNAADQLPEVSHGEEAKPLVEAYLEARACRRGVRPIADILPLVLARLGVSDLQLDQDARETN